MFEVDEEVANESVTIKNMIEGACVVACACVTVDSRCLWQLGERGVRVYATTHHAPQQHTQTLARMR